jgi:6-pyruvoyltetrahydropterin/6-carboxytetrahydropterin synthase
MILLTQQFEFSAAHRLHNPDLSDEKNRDLFGKCNNPHGHGHNYLVDVTVGIDETENGNSANLLSALEATVRKQVIDRVDHRNLNVEIAEFKSLNPTVENIAVVFWNWISASPCPGTLRNVRVYETPKTWVDYSGNIHARYPL